LGTIIDTNLDIIPCSIHSKLKDELDDIKDKTLQEHFNSTQDLSQRNKDIITAIENGYKQSEIARHLKISPAMVSKIFRGVK